MVGAIDGRVKVFQSTNPIHAFVRAIEGADTSRFARCPACNAFLYDLRTDMTTCSARCANLRRVWRHRKQRPDYEQRRKFKHAGVRLLS